MRSHLSPVRGNTTSALEENTMKDTLIFGLKEAETIMNCKIKFTLWVGQKNDLFSDLHYNYLVVQ